MSTQHHGQQKIERLQAVHRQLNSTLEEVRSIFSGDLVDAVQQTMCRNTVPRFRANLVTTNLNECRLDVESNIDSAMKEVRIAIESLEAAVRIIRVTHSAHPDSAIIFWA